MKKNYKIYLNYGDELPENFFSALKAADDNDLRVMLALVSSRSDKPDLDNLCRELELDESELEASVKYWCGAGLLRKGKASSSKQQADTKSTEKASTSPSAHRGGKLERKSELPSYSSSELAELIEKRRISAEFINEAQRVVGKIFNTHEVNILVGMVDYIGFDEESVIILLSYMSKKGKRSLRYAEQIAFSLFDEGITDSKALQERLRKMEEYSNVEAKVKSMFGMSGRDLTAKEKKYMHAWIEKMGYGEDVIRLAYDITVDATHEPIPAYANSILEKWYAAGLLTYESVRQAEEDKKNASDGARLDAKSYDTDEFFAAALKRTFDEL
ncbi:MAG: DnaD domain protein [Clostridia bacterium]|nr:DnaD domain protein [Clostridia bacterium]